MARGPFKSFRQTQTKTKRDGRFNHIGRIAGNSARLGQDGRESSVSEKKKEQPGVYKAALFLGALLMPCVIFARVRRQFAYGGHRKGVRN
jgi:hypothetical protein